MTDAEKIINELNRFLRGRYMGLAQYERLIAHAKNRQLQEMLQRFQQQVKQEIEQVANRIQQLNGEAIDGAGMWGEIQIWIQKIKAAPEDTEAILREALLGENKYGIRFSHELVAGELDETSTRLIDTILEADQRRVEQLKAWLSKEKASVLHPSR